MLCPSISILHSSQIVLQPRLHLYIYSISASGLQSQLLSTSYTAHLGLLVGALILCPCLVPQRSPYIDPTVHIGFQPRSIEEKLLCIKIIQKYHNHSSYPHHRSQKINSISSISDRPLDFYFLLSHFERVRIYWKRRLPQRCRKRMNRRQ